MIVMAIAVVLTIVITSVVAVGGSGRKRRKLRTDHWSSW